MESVKRSLFDRFTSRPFLLSVVGSISGYVAWKYKVPSEIIGFATAPIVAFILGESYRDGKQAEATPNHVQNGLIQSLALEAVAHTVAEKCDGVQDDGNDQ